jgi:hypothetical protein
VRECDQNDSFTLLPSSASPRCHRRRVLGRETMGAVVLAGAHRLEAIGHPVIGGRHSSGFSGPTRTLAKCSIDSLIFTKSPLPFKTNAPINGPASSVEPPVHGRLRRRELFSPERTVTMVESFLTLTIAIASTSHSPRRHHNCHPRHSFEFPSRNQHPRQSRLHTRHRLNLGILS